MIISRQLLPESIRHLPDDIVDEMIRRAESSPHVKSLHTDMSKAISRHDYIKASNISNRITNEILRMLKKCYDEFDGEVVEMKEFFKSMSQEDISEMNISIHSLLVCIDMIETISMDMQQMLDKYNFNARISMFDDIVNLGNKSKNHLRYLNSRVDNVHQCNFGDACDDVMGVLRDRVMNLMIKCNDAKVIE